jgi:hypothetical protein
MARKARKTVGGGIFGKLPSNTLIGYENGKWGFVGSVDVRLAKLLDGQVIETEDQLAEAARRYQVEMYGMVRRRLTSRVWDSQEEALQAAAALGLETTLPRSA